VPALRALRLQRNERALSALLQVVASGGLADAMTVVAGLGARRFDGGVRERTRDTIGAHPEAKRLQAAFAAAFPDNVGS
jgi:hypothetical protein